MTAKTPPALEVGAQFRSDERLTAEKTRLRMVLQGQMSCCKTVFSRQVLILLGFINTENKCLPGKQPLLKQSTGMSCHQYT